MNIWPIAMNGFREHIRQKILYVIVIFSFVIILTALLYKTLAINQEVKLMKDVGLAAMFVLGMLIAIFAGTNAVSREIDSKTIHTLLAKPVKRSEFVLGKFLGAGLATLFNFAVMAVGFLIIVGFIEKASPLYLLTAIMLAAVELLILISASIFFSTILPQAIATIFTLLLFLTGHITSLLPYLIRKAEGIWAKITASVFYYLLPNLQYFNLRAEAVSHATIPLSLILLTIIYGALYTVIGLILSILVIRGKDFA
jgi:ABC-type transport system involved in multi-copper enzyme maturation permease subunit